MGCLPPGYTLNDLLNQEQFCTWIDRDIKWVRQHLRQMKGIIGGDKGTRGKGNRAEFRVHPATYLKGELGKLDPEFLNISRNPSQT